MSSSSSSPTGGQSVTVIIATVAHGARALTLRRAVRSALEQIPQPRVMVVVNGPSYDRAACAEFEEEPQVELHYLEIPSYPAAQRHGRALVNTAYFCFLDDDDMLLPGSVGVRLERAEQHDRPDVVVSNGYRLKEEGDVPNYPPPLPTTDSDLLASLLKRNWFASCAPLFRSARADVTFFDGRSKYFEWTLLAYRMLLAQRSFAFVPDFLFRLTDSPVSLSKDDSSSFAEPGFLRDLIELGPPPHVRGILLRRLADSHHKCSIAAARRGETKAAWYHHMRSLLYPGGLRFSSYTRRLLLGNAAPPG